MKIILQNILQEEYIIQMVLLNFLPLCSTIFFIIFKNQNNPYDNKIIKIFRVVTICMYSLLFIDNVDLYTTTFKTGVLSQTISSVLGYNLRLAILLSIIFVISRDEKQTNFQRWFISIPAIITFFITLTAFNTHLMFWYEDFEIRRGPFSYTPHIVCLIYGLSCIMYGIKFLTIKERRDEGIIIIYSICFMFIATVLETIFQIRGILIGLIAIAINFYYLYMYLDNFKKDELTKIFNRASFNAYKKTYRKEITALIAMDLNNLKKINDTKGHEEGDKAIITVAKSATKILKKYNNKCIIFRLGGDEFEIICCKTEEATVQNIIQEIKEELSQTPYTCALGYCMITKEVNLEQAFTIADKQMYIDKNKFKERISEVAK